jgi:cytoskeletal protein CcmA (bactofilin family)
MASSSKRKSKKSRGKKPSSAPQAPVPMARISGQFEGNISASGDLHIAQGAQCRANIRASRVSLEGQFTGTIAARGSMRVGSNGACRGQFSAKSLQVDGQVEGEAFVQDRMDLSPSSAMKGHIVAGRLVVADGASFDGRCTVGKFAQQKSRKAA